MTDHVGQVVEAGHTPQPLAALKEEVRADLLKEKLAEGRLLASDAMKVVLIFLAVTGLLVNVVKDSTGRADLFLFFCAMGVATSLFHVFVCATENLIRKAVADDIRRLNESLQSPLIHVDLTTLRYISLTSLLFGFLTAVGWVVLIVLYRAGGLR